MEAYREVTGDFENSEMAIGGATYARFLPCAVSFAHYFLGNQNWHMKTMSVLVLTVWKKLQKYT